MKKKRKHMKEIIKKISAISAAATLAFTSLSSAAYVSAEEESEITQFMGCFMPMPIIEELTEDC